MYTSYLNASSVNMRVSYSDQYQSKAKSAQTPANADYSNTKNTEGTGSSSNFSDILSIASKDAVPVDNIKAYVNDSVAKVLEKIAAHASETMKGQGEYSVSITSISITIELDEGESLSDVKSELDDMLGDDGYWGVEQTSQRIFDFAKNLAGDDVDALENARQAVMKGFEQAKAIMGGELPQISHDTLSAAMDKFDTYIEQLNGSLTETYA